jgi:hypothetical protein
MSNVDAAFRRQRHGGGSPADRAPLAMMAGLPRAALEVGAGSGAVAEQMLAALTGAGAAASTDVGHDPVSLSTSHRPAQGSSLVLIAIVIIAVVVVGHLQQGVDQHGTLLVAQHRPAVDHGVTIRRHFT